MLTKLLRMSRGGPDVEVGIGCLVPVAMVIAMLVGAGVVVGTHLGQSGQTTGPDRVIVRVIDDGAAGRPNVIATAVVPIR
jgi:hypothetical protein